MFKKKDNKNKVNKGSKDKGINDIKKTTKKTIGSIKKPKQPTSLQKMNALQKLRLTTGIIFLSATLAIPLILNKNLAALGGILALLSYLLVLILLIKLMITKNL